MSAPPPGKRFGSFFNGGRQIIWLDAKAKTPSRTSTAGASTTRSPAPTSSSYRSPFRASSTAAPARRTPLAASSSRARGTATQSFDLYVASSLGQTAEVTRLVGEGSSPNERGLEGDTCLNAAVKNGHSAVVAVLLQAGADPSSAVHGGKTPLHGACEIGADTIVAALLSAGANPRIADDSGESPRDTAARLGHPVCAAVIDRHMATSRGAPISERHAARSSSPERSPDVKQRVRERRERLAREREEAAAENERKQAEIARMRAQMGSSSPSDDTKRQMAEMVFDKLDENGDGIITKKEFKTGLAPDSTVSVAPSQPPPVSPRVAAAAAAAAPVGEPESIVDRTETKFRRSPTQPAAATAAPAPAPELHGTPGEQVAQLIFNKLDADHDGVVTNDEFRKGLAPNHQPEEAPTQSQDAPAEQLGVDEQDVDDSEIAKLYDLDGSPRTSRRKTLRDDMETHVPRTPNKTKEQEEEEKEQARAKQEAELQLAVQKRADDHVSYGKLVPALLDLEKLGGRLTGIVDLVRQDMTDANDVHKQLDTEGADTEGELRQLIHDISQFEDVIQGVSDAKNARECEPQVKKRRGCYKTLTEPVRKNLAIQQQRSKVLEARGDRNKETVQAVVATIGSTKMPGASDGSPAAYPNALDSFARFIEVPAEGGEERSKNLRSGFTKLILEPLERLVEYSGDDATVFSTLVQGDSVDCDVIAEREAQREDTEVLLYHTVQEADAACRVLMREAKQYLEDESKRIKDDMERAMGLAVVLQEKLQILEKLPELEKEAKNLLKELRKADKNQRKVRARIIAVENRLDEADELGQISSDSESEEEWSDDEEDFYLGDMTVEQLKAKQEELKVTLDDIIQLKKDHIYKLIQLTEELPELRFHPKLKPAVAAFQRERIAAAKEREQALQAASSAASP